MQLIFKRFTEYFTLDIDRKNRKVNVNGEQTNYVNTQVDWNMLWDKCEVHKKEMNRDNSKCEECKKVAMQQDLETQKLSDSDFVKLFEKQMGMYGFNMVKCQY